MAQAKQKLSMTRKKVISGMIKSIGYNPETKEMDVEFTSREIYTYNPISQRKYDNLVNADSIGGHFNRNIKGRTDIRVRKTV